MPQEQKTIQDEWDELREQVLSHIDPKSMNTLGPLLQRIFYAGALAATTLVGNSFSDDNIPAKESADYLLSLHTECHHFFEGD